MTIGSHQRTIGASQCHLTPRFILDALGPFDLDPCAADPRPWDCAARNISEAEDGLAAEWAGRVWLNPPFDRRVVGWWLRKLAQHGDGIALLHARTETAWFRAAWESADAMLFLGQRVHFCRPDGTEHDANSGAPIVLVAYGAENAGALRRCGIHGHLVTVWQAVR